MAFCTNCGAEVQPGTRFCPSCGNALAAADATRQAPRQEAPRPDPWEQQANRQNEQTYSQPQQPTYTAQPAMSRDASDNRYLCILCYFGILLLIPLLSQPNSAYCRYHSNQGLVLLLLGIALSIVAIIPILGWIVDIVGVIFVAVCFIMGIVNTCKGEMKPLPIIGKINILH